MAAPAARRTLVGQQPGFSGSGQPWLTAAVLGDGHAPVRARESRAAAHPRRRAGGPPALRAIHPGAGGRARLGGHEHVPCGPRS